MVDCLKSPFIFRQRRRYTVRCRHSFQHIYIYPFFHQQQQIVNAADVYRCLFATYVYGGDADAAALLTMVYGCCCRSMLCAHEKPFDLCDTHTSFSNEMKAKKKRKNNKPREEKDELCVFVLGCENFLFDVKAYNFSLCVCVRERK